MWYCGWDGGGTKTEVCVLDEAGKEMDRQSFGPLNPNGVEPECIRRTVRDAIAFMNLQPGGPDECGGLVIGTAGITSLNTEQILERELRQAGWTRSFRLTGDEEIALAGAVEGHGAILIAGTGAICFGRDLSGRIFRVGGYGWRIDDEGGGYAIGRDILKAVIRAEDQRDNPTILKRMVEKELRLPPDRIREMITWVYAPETGKKEIASLARLLPEALAADDSAAVRIAEKAAAALAELAVTGWRKTGMRDGELAMTGSIVLKIPAIQSLVRESILSVYPEIRILEPRRTPAFGAAELARKGAL